MAGLLASLCLLGLSACGAIAQVDSPRGKIAAVGAESQYANVISQIGGRYVSVSAVLNNPNADPHSFESSPKVTSEISEASLVVQNGLGYDSFMNKVEAASPNPHRRVIVVQRILEMSSEARNPHVWYDPSTMPRVARAIASALAEVLPSHGAYFRGRLARFDASLRPWLSAVAHFKANHTGSRVATTEPVGDDLLRAMGIKVLTPFRFQADVMNGVDPAPEDIALVRGTLRRGHAQALCYNEQVVDPLTASMRQTAIQARVPVVALYETLPAKLDYQSWMRAETKAIARALLDGKSTNRI